MKALFQRPVFLAFYAGIVAFCTYSCMYAFRKGFAVGEYDYLIFGMQAKVVFVVSQLMGYTLSKFIGIKLISGLQSANRVPMIIGLNAVAWLALLCFAIAPPPLKAVCMFATGLPLGLIWGLVFSFLEGRKTTELMGAFLCVSFIFSSGFVKTVAQWISRTQAIDESWVPFATGAVFVLPLIFFTWLLSRIPPPDKEDRALRVERLPMTKIQRQNFWKKYALGLSLLIIVYVMLTILRDFRDNFMADVWRENHIDSVPALFTRTEIPASLIILLLIGFMYRIRNNKTAFSVSLLVVLLGTVISGVATILFVKDMLNVVHWMTWTGLGLYMGYIPFNTMVYERLIAILRQPANIGFLMYTSDALGYLGSMGVLIINEWMPFSANWTRFLSSTILFASAIGAVFTLISWIYFNKKHKTYA